MFPGFVELDSKNGTTVDAAAAAERSFAIRLGKDLFSSPLNNVSLYGCICKCVCVCTERRLSWIVSVIFPFNLLTFPGDTFRNFWLSHGLGLRFCFETRSIACAFFCPVTLSPFVPHSMENVWVARHRTWKGKIGRSGRNDNGRSIHANRMPIIGNRVPAYLHFFFLLHPLPIDSTEAF